jgi:ABC-type lipoprotein export system ATPase subunit
MTLAPLVHTSSRPLIELNNVVKVFKTSAGEFYALKNINLTFERGEFTSIMGKSGSGKSTLINMITGIDHPTSGSVRVGDVELQKMKEGQLAVWRGRAMGIVFQFFQLLPTLTILENTLLPMDYCNMYPLAEREGRAHDLLAMLGLQDMADKLPAALSGGQQQIAAIARALANDPPIIIADEPTGNLDSQTEKLILNIFEDLASRGKTILIVTHDPTLGRRSTRRVLISDGELVNEVVAQALPALGHSQMLKITRLVKPRTFEPGVAIARRGAIDEGLYIVTGGTVQVTSERRSRATEMVGQIHVGQCFSEFELLESEYHDLCFRASLDEPVKTLCLPQEALSQLIEEAPAVEHVLRQAAFAHLTQYFPKAALAATHPVEDRHPVVDRPARRKWFFGGRK